MKRILLLADINSPHLHKWAGGLSAAGLDIGVFSFTDDSTGWIKKFPSISLFSSKKINRNLFFSSEIKKLQFLRLLPDLRRVIKSFKPEIVHAHYATSYGLLGALSGFNPFFISVWGSDVYEFPEKGFLHASMLRFNLSRANRIFSTGYSMAAEVKKYTGKNIEVIHYGINPKVFMPMEVQSLFEKNDIVIGTVKSLETIYGIEYLIRAFKIVKDSLPQMSIKLMLVGEGSKRNYFEDLVKSLQIVNDVKFVGHVSNEKIAVYHNMLTIAVYLSNAESFGVSVIESSACEKPVVVSNVGGLPEVVKDGITGIIVPPANPQAAAEAIMKLINNQSLARQLGENGRKHVLELYDWNRCLEQMINAYQMP